MIAESRDPGSVTHGASEQLASLSHETAVSTPYKAIATINRDCT